MKRKPDRIWYGGATKRLTRKQLQNDLDAARMHVARAEEAATKETQARQEDRQKYESARAAVLRLTEERDDWKFAFKIICKLAEKP